MTDFAFDVTHADVDVSQHAQPLLDAAEAALEAGDIEPAASLLDDAEPLLRTADERTHMAALRARLAHVQRDAGDLDALRTAVATNADNLDDRLQLANALALAGDYRTACEHLLDLVQRDRQWNDEAGRKGLLKIFSALAADSRHEELIREYRVKLARTLN